MIRCWFSLASFRRVVTCAAARTFEFEVVPPLRRENLVTSSFMEISEEIVKAPIHESPGFDNDPPFTS